MGNGEARRLHACVKDTLMCTRCYLEAWSYASEQPAYDAQDTKATAALHKSFIPNWTCQEFRGFVSECEAVVNAYCTFLGADRKYQDNDGDGHRAIRGCQDAFDQILWLEQRFWPHV